MKIKNNKAIKTLVIAVAIGFIASSLVTIFIDDMYFWTKDFYLCWISGFYITNIIRRDS